MSDLISRQAVYDTLTEYYHHKTDIQHKALAEALSRVPLSPSRPQWIPCSERLPEEMGTYMTTIDYGEHGLVTGQRYYYGRGLKWNDECVIAWMPLPEPYNAESELYD